MAVLPVNHELDNLLKGTTRIEVHHSLRPDYIIAGPVAAITNATPAHRANLVASLEPHMKKPVLSILMESIELPDDTRIYDEASSHALPMAGCLSALLSDPRQYGPFVRNIKVVDPLSFSVVDNLSPSLLQFEDGSASDLGPLIAPAHICPIPAQSLLDILSTCPNLETFEWISSCPPPDGICEVCGTRVCVANQ